MNIEKNERYLTSLRGDSLQISIFIFFHFIYVIFNWIEDNKHT